jgi:hypothetical protein
MGFRDHGQPGDVTVGSVFDRIREWWRNRPPAEGYNERPGAYDVRPTYELSSEDDPGLGGVTRRPVITRMEGFDPHGAPQSIVGEREPGNIIDGLDMLELGHVWGVPVLMHPDVKAEIMAREARGEKFTMSLVFTPDPNEEGMGTEGKWTP